MAIRTRLAGSLCLRRLARDRRSGGPETATGGATRTQRSPLMKREFVDPSTTTEADRALRLRKDLADAQAKLREAEQWREQAARAARLEREAATLRERVAELEGHVQRLRERPAPTPRHVERCAQAKLNRRLFAENERLKQEARDGL